MLGDMRTTVTIQTQHKLAVEEGLLECIQAHGVPGYLRNPGHLGLDYLQRFMSCNICQKPGAYASRFRALVF